MPRDVDTPNRLATIKTKSHKSEANQRRLSLCLARSAVTEPQPRALPASLLNIKNYILYRVYNDNSTRDRQMAVNKT